MAPGWQHLNRVATVTVSARSSPLAVTLLRDPAEEVCIGGASGPK